MRAIAADGDGRHQQQDWLSEVTPHPGLLWVPKTCDTWADALQIAVGSFVSPRYTPQMAEVDVIAAALEPVPGVEFQALTLNAKGAERRARYPVLSDRWTNRPALVAVILTNRVSPSRERPSRRGWPRSPSSSRPASAVGGPRNSSRA